MSLFQFTFRILILLVSGTITSQICAQESSNEQNDGFDNTAQTVDSFAEERVDEPETTRSQKYDRLDKAFMTELTNFANLHSDKGLAEQMALMDQSLAIPEKHATGFVELILENPTDEVAVKSLRWLIKSIRFGKHVDKAFDVFYEANLDSSNLKKILFPLAYGGPSAKNENRLRKIIENSTHRDVRAFGKYYLAQYLELVRPQAQSVQKLNPIAAMISLSIVQKIYGDGVSKYLRKFDTSSQEIESLYQDLVANYYDIETKQSGKLGILAEKALKKIATIAIGKLAPETTGTDMDGTEFKLRDYRGKVVVLTFWGDW